MSELKGYMVGGCIAVAENEEEAIQMYKDKVGESWINYYKESCRVEPWHDIKENNLDEWFRYFNKDEIDKEDYKYIYDEKHLSDGITWVSLKRPYARKYCKDGFYDKKEIGDIII